MRKKLSCRQYALKILAVRQYSLYELKKKLEGKNYELSEINDTIGYLKDIDFLNDERFAYFFINEKMRLKNFGQIRLKQELKKRGVKEEVIRKVFAEVYSDESIEEELIKKEINKYKRIKKTEDPEKTERRLVAHLIRKGFSSTLIRKYFKSIDIPD